MTTESTDSGSSAFLKNCTCFDWKALTGAMEECFPDMSRREVSFHCRQHRKRLMRVLYSHNRCVGFAISQPKPDAGVFWIGLIGIRPGFQRRGFGRLLLGDCEAEAAERGYAEVGFVVDDDNAAAIALYERNGYELRAEDSGKRTYGKRIQTSRPREEPARQAGRLTGFVATAYWRLLYAVLVGY